MSWLVRSPKLQITGTFTDEEIKQKIQAGEFSGDYELCSGNNYWFYLYESKELESQLGITLPSHMVTAAAASAEEARGEITEDFPEESSRTFQFNKGAIQKPAVQKPLAPRPNAATDVTPPPGPVEKPSAAMKAIFIIVALLAAWFLIRR